MSERISAISIYLSEIKKNLADGNATEHTHRPALKTLLETVDKGITATNEPKRILCGSPDFQITRKGVPLGHVETKDIGTNLDEMQRGKGPHGEQFTRYRDGLPNWILTDYLQFHWFVNAEKRLTVCITELDAKGKLKLLPDGEEKLVQLLIAFLRQEALTVGTAKDLARRMAGMTRIIRDLIINTFNHEKEQGLLHNWLAAFRETLIPDLNEKQFADMFAQTLAYGLFAAWINTPLNKVFSREMAAYNLPKTNPFLRKLFAQIGGVDMPDSIAWAVDDIVQLLKHADMSGILKDFGKCRGKEDPVVHFYETFLAAYDSKMREVRGVYYTPEPVVSYIVRSIDHLLKTRFNRPKGLADENTLILDPATGTATFLYFVIDQIHQKFAKQAGAWDDYVAKHLLNRIFGFELLMAPYAVAHLKIGMQLQETGYKFGSDQRLGIYLTNTLEEAAKKSEQLFAGWVADEANAAAEIKKDLPIMVVLGNPPYSGHSANRSYKDVLVEKGHMYVGSYEIINNFLMPVKKKASKRGVVRVPNFIGGLVREYYVVDGIWLDEKNPKWLQDDYVKFIRFAEWRIARTDEGILGYITNHGYLDNPTFRGMRQHLMHTFDEIYVLDLHGNYKKKEKAPDGGKDDNVFDIQQGVAILLAVKSKPPTRDTETGREKKLAHVFHADLWGQRETNEGDRLAGGKYHWLWQNSAETSPWQELNPSSPFYLFRPQDMELKAEYERGWKTSDAIPLNVLGFQTHRDEVAVAFEESVLHQQVATYLGEPPGTESWWKYRSACLYRPFDTRFVYLDKKVADRPRKELVEHVLGRENLCLGIGRQGIAVNDPEWCLVAVSRTPVDANIFRRGGISIFPLYLYPTSGELDALVGRRPNFNPAFLKALWVKLKLAPEGPHGLPNGITPEDIFHYAYAVFHSPTYRKRYAEFLKIDFPRLPLTSDVNLFRALASKGAALVALHLMESPKLQEFITAWLVKGDNVVEKVRYTEKNKRVWINKTQYFGGVPKAVWEFHIGGYQVCDKWLKDRKRRALSYDDVMHYQKIVVALKETLRLMTEIDECIPRWPLA